MEQDGKDWEDINIHRLHGLRNLRYLQSVRAS